ncbi:HAD family hydrolase [Leptospira jelokensis]|uniref:HAD family hydrolase n=1 Tax=Leptospira jelokensis TaxID=2484931 RepID=A0A4Z0ZSH5_9LEPT|nr:HAD family hydrolase [Leptospira jelokensis]TGL65654.1 HAD family hydrolase [Leptospira jelokensis]
MALFLDLDNTLLPSKKAYNYAITQCATDWRERGLGDNFLELYELARKQVKSQLKHHSSNRLRLLCFKLVWEHLRSKDFGKNSEILKNTSQVSLSSQIRFGFQTEDIQEILWMEERYFFHFLHFYAEEKKKLSYKDSLFPLLISLSHEFPIYLTTNETLRTQLLKVQGFLPKGFRFTIITSEEVGFEKPTTEFFQYVIQKAGEDPNDCILLGDNWDDDIIGASSHGISCIHIPDMWGEGDEINEIHGSEGSIEGNNRVPGANPKNIWRASNIISGLTFARSWLLERQK